MEHLIDIIIVILLLFQCYCVRVICKTADRLFDENNDLRLELEELKCLKHDNGTTGRQV